MEATEISEFSKEMREAGEASMTRVSLIISILAVLVALVTVFSHREHTEAVLQQARATDRWNEYQARRIRQTEVGLALDMLSIIPGANPALAGSKLQDYKARLDHVQEQLQEDSREAKALETEVALAERRASRLDLGEALLQIAVVLASITLLTRQWRYVLAALFLGSIGILAAGSMLLVR